MSACSIQTIPNAPRKPIKVNGVVISRAMISREVQNHPAASPAAAWKEAALALVVREALAQEVRRRGIKAEPLVEGERRETPEEARMRALVDSEVAVPAPSEEECRRYYERNLPRFRSGDLYEAAHILIPAPADDAAARDAARLQARALIEELAQAPECFADLARLVSACPSAKTGGNLGQVGAGQTTPAFEAALRRMTPGTLSEPVETPYGIHVIRLDRKIEGRQLPFELVRERIAAYLADAVRRRASAQWVARLLAGCRIEGIEVPAPQHLNVH